jgi:hypothetical protein
VVVDDPGHEREPVGIDGLPGAAQNPSDFDDPAVFHRHAAAARRRAAAIEEHRVADDEIEHRGQYTSRECSI